MNLAVIPARGGSKRVPRKNIRAFAGQPMIAWSIEAALESGCFERVIVSTDDEEIATVAQRYGALVPFRRGADLADDHTGTIPVVADAVRRDAEAGFAPDMVCCLYATAPFVTAADIRRGQQALQDSGADYAFTATSYPFPIQRAIRMGPDGHVGMFWPEHFNSRSQDLEPAFHDAGQFYWGNVQAWLECRPIFSSAAVAVLQPRHRVQDIDTPEDWERAEWMYQAQRRA